MSDIYTQTRKAIEEATSQEEVFKLFEGYDKTEGALLKRSEEIDQRLLDIDHETNALETELCKLRANIPFGSTPIKELAAVKVFDLIRAGEGNK